ncbi:helix-turn-helix transcriptional regulator [Pseudonocardia adelaidensis]|uniref:LuxR C-terminal-related transcriptional regulator n=1 Tax=Pseudonocardia adelaidensis TaxID=648754 RepID=A0ABP9P6G8_9PSEU
MARRRNAANGERDVVRACHSGLDIGGVQSQVLRALRRVVPIDAAFFATADPVTLQFTGAVSEEPLVAAAPRFLANELSGADVNTFTSLATSAAHVATLDTATGRSRLDSERYREIMRPVGLGDELRAALVAGSECWGYLCLHRADGPLGFSQREAAVIARLGPHIAHALRLALLGSPGPVPGDSRQPGVLLVTDDLTPVASTPEAEQLLSLLAPGPGGALPIAVHAVVATLSAIERGSAAPSRLPRATVRTRDGAWLDVHASRLRGSAGIDRVTVVLEPARPHTTAAVQLAAYGLTRRENEVATRVLRGESNRAIAGALQITEHTVHDHIKAIFDKAGVRKRGELAGRLLAPPAPD